MDIGNGMKELDELINKKQWLEAKQYIIENRDQIEQIADCLLEEIDILQKWFIDKADGVDFTGVSFVHDTAHGYTWDTVKDSMTRCEAVKKIDDAGETLQDKRRVGIFRH